MELRHLKTFVCVARHLSFNRAAEMLNYAQSSVSAQIAALEKEVGARLFDRLGRRILLTEAGETLLGFAAKMLDLEETALAEMTGGVEARGALTIRVPETICVCRFPALLGRFRAIAPRVELKLIACTHDALARDLRKGVTDLAFLLTDAVVTGDLEVEALGTEPLLLVASPKHPLAARGAIGTADLAGQTLLLSSVDCSYRRLLERLMAEGAVAPGAILELASVAAIKEGVAHGLGITVIPAITVERELADGRLVALPSREPGLEVAALMIWLQARWLSPSLKTFMGLAREVLYPPPEPATGPPSGS